MTIIKKIAGLALIGVGIVLLRIGYTVTIAISALGGWIADQVGATATATVGITVLSFVPLLGFMFAIGLSIAFVVMKGIHLLK